MNKPLIASSFFTFPRLLVWSLPMGFLLAYAWLYGRPSVTEVGQWVAQTEEVIATKV